MFRSVTRSVAAMVVGILMALPLAAAAQAPPVTAPTGEFPVNPERGTKPGVSTATGPTSIPGWNHPPESWASPSEEPQYASLPGREANILIQVTGREWRTFHNGPLTQYGGWLIALVFVAIMAFYFVKGAIRLRGKPTGRMIERFSVIERSAHWTTAICFVALALTGTSILWGKYLILPWLGYNGFSWLIVVAKTLHNFVGPLFIVALLVAFLLFVKDNLWRAYDFKWLVRLGNMFSTKGEEIPSGRFNGGEKAWFWGGLAFLGAIVSVTGLVLDFPNLNQGREIMQIANSIHAIGAILFISASFGHIYIGTIGTEGAFGAMGKGYVDEEWAREHHVLWYEEVRQGKRPGKVIRDPS